MLIMALAVACTVAAVIVALFNRMSGIGTVGDHAPAGVWTTRVRVLLPAAMGGVIGAVASTFVLGDRVQGFGGAPASVRSLPEWAADTIYFLASRRLAACYLTPHRHDPD
jgi:hypothetical protein